MRDPNNPLKYQLSSFPERLVTKSATAHTLHCRTDSALGNHLLMGETPEVRLHDIKVGQEPLMTYLLPLSLLCFVLARYSDPNEFTRHCLFFAFYQWILSLKNVVIGPLKKDSGLVLWLVMMVSAHYESKWGLIASTGYASVSNGVVCGAIGMHRPWHNGFHKSARYFKKSVLWCQIFFYYLGSWRCPSA